MEKYFTLLTASLLIQSCLPSTNQLKSFNKNENNANIINGAILADDQLPQMSLLSYSEGYCSATLIGPNVIITAAHCVLNEPEPTFGPVNGKYYKVKLTRHINYDGIKDIGSEAKNSDIAFGILEKEITDITPITISNQNPNINDKILIAGAGKPTPGIRQFGYSKIFQKGKTGFIICDWPSFRPHIAGLGDSGGPNFMVNANNELSLFSITSTSNFEVSYSTANVINHVDNPSALFINEFVQKNNLKVCGINITCDQVSLITNGKNYETSLILDIGDTKDIELTQEASVKNNIPLIHSIKKSPIIYAHTGAIENFSKIEANGKFALLSADEIDLPEKINNAKNAGAIGIILYLTNDHSKIFLNELNTFPIAIISNNDGRKLVAFLEAGTLSFAELKVTERNFSF